MESLFHQLTAFDWIVIGLIGLMTISGLLRGFTHEALSLSGWILAILAVRFGHEYATLWLAPRLGSDAAAAIIAFILIFFGTILVARAIASAAGGFARRSMIGPLDRLLGGGFGAVKGLILSAVLFLLIAFGTSVFDPARQPPRWLAASQSAPLMSMTAGLMVGWVKELQDGNSFTLPEQHALPFPSFPPQVLPPQLEQRLPPGHPLRREPPADQGGYSRADREALDKLLDEAAAEGKEVSI